MPKIFLSYNQQIEKLKNEKNLQIDDEIYAKEVLRQTSYYSLIGGYKDIFKNPTTKKYKDGTRFEDIVELYYFDESLRQLFLKYLIKVENEIKSQVSYYFAEKNGENQKEYLDIANYNYVGKKNQRDSICCLFFDECVRKSFEYVQYFLTNYIKNMVYYGYRAGCIEDR